MISPPPAELHWRSEWPQLYEEYRTLANPSAQSGLTVEEFKQTFICSYFKFNVAGIIESLVQAGWPEAEAEAYANDRLPRSRGQAARDIAEATAYREQLVAEAEGDAARFTALLTEYKQAPKITRERLYLDAIGDVMSNSSKIMLDVDQSNPLLYLPLDQLTKGAGASAPQSTSSFSSAAPSTSSHSDSGARDSRSRDRGRR